MTHKKSRPSLSNSTSLQRTLEIQASSLPPLKGEGCGNTFLIFDCLEATFFTLEDVIREAHPILLKENRDDALILRKEYEDAKKLVLTMTVLEPDGSIAEFCGNGARVVSCYLQHKFDGHERSFYLKTSRGMRRIWAYNDLYHVEMGKTFLRSGHNRFFNPHLETFQLGLGMRQFTFFWTETLEPHLVTFDAIEEHEMRDLGLYLNHHQRSFFPQGININSAQIISGTCLSVITFERGVNRITAACGTGATSCVMLAKAIGHIDKKEKIKVLLKGGTIMVDPRNGNAVMSGPASIER